VEETAVAGTDSQTYTYDDLNRLLTASATGGVANYSQTYAYNQIGNLTNFAGTAYAYNDAAHKQAVTHLAGVQKFWYDANGNMTTRIDGSTTYTQAFDVENRLTSVTPSGGSATTFAYDANGIRTKTVQPGGITTYFPFPGYEETVNGANTIKRSSYSFAGQTVAMRVSGDPVSGNNGLFYVLSDHLGSTSMLVNSSGGVVAGSTTRNLPYGGYRPGSAPTQTITDRDFTGQKENMELGLLYYQARFYVPGIGRFASADTIVPNPANPQSYNRYSYVLNSPINLTDPSGHNPLCNGDGSICSDGADDVGRISPRQQPKQPLPPKNLITHLPIAKDTATGVDEIDWLGGFGANWFSQDPIDCCYGQSHNIHTGLDFGADVGTTVYATVSGTVVLKYVRENGKGDAVPHVVIEVIVGDLKFYVVHGHVDPSVDVGAIVKGGDVIGTVAPHDYPHVHLSIRRVDTTGSGQDWAYNPLLFMAPELSAMLTIDNADKYYGNETPTSMVGFRYGTGSYFDEEARKNMEIIR
jgi:RHS repeat-associated protein